MPDKDRPSRTLKTLTKGARKEARGVAGNRKHFSASLEAIKEEGGEEAFSDIRDSLKLRKMDYAHELAVMGRKNSAKEHYRNTWLFGGIAGAILFLLAAAISIPIFCTTCKDTTLVASSLIFLLGTLMGYLFGRRGQPYNE